jgi:lysozyme family protein
MSSLMRDADLFFDDLFQIRPRSRAARRYGEGDQEDTPWTPEQEQAFRDWWKKIGGFEGSYDQWRANAANKADRGGETNWGITWGTYQNIRKNGTKEEFKAMTLEDAMGIARILYRTYKVDQIRDPGVGLLFADWQWGGISKTAVNRALARAGQPQVAKFTNTGPDQATIDALNAADPQQMIAALDAERLQAIQDDIARNPAQAVFEKGWRRRIIIRWVQAKMITGHTDDAARWLNGQSKEELTALLGNLSREEIAALHDAAVAGSGVGADSQFARMTKARRDAWVNRSGPR